LGTISAFQFIDRPWAEYKLSVLRGTYAHEEKARSTDIFKEIEIVGIVGKTSFDCPDGVYSVAGGKYLAVDQWFVNWGFSSNDNPKIGSVRIICDRSKDYAISESARFGMNMVYYQSNSANKSVAILRR